MREGRLEKLGRSWFGTPATPPDVRLALRAGQRLTCISALAHHGLWVPRDGRRHVSAVRTPAGSRGAGGGLHHRYRESWRTDAPVMPIREALQDAMSCLSAEDLAIILESAHAHGVLAPGEIDDLVRELPVQKRRRVGRISTAAQSGTETRVRRFLERLRVRVREQVQILPGEYVDLLVGERLVIECDSRAHHSVETAYANDRRRDRELVLRGYWVVRLTWEDVMLRWPATRALLRALLREGRHRAPRRRQADGSRIRRVRS